MLDSTKKTINKDLKKLINKDCILVFNKSDLNKKIPKNEFKENDQILISVKNNKNINNLIKTVKLKLSKKFIKTNDTLVTRERHRIKLKAALKEIEKFLKKIKKKR